MDPRGTLVGHVSRWAPVRYSAPKNTIKQRATEGDTGQRPPASTGMHTYITCVFRSMYVCHTYTHSARAGTVGFAKIIKNNQKNRTQVRKLCWQGGAMGTCIPLSEKERVPGFGILQRHHTVRSQRPGRGGCGQGTGKEDQTWE